VGRRVRVRVRVMSPTDAVRAVLGWQSPTSRSHVLARLPMRAGAMLCSCRYLVRGRGRGRVSVRVRCRVSVRVRVRGGVRVRVRGRGGVRARCRHHSSLAHCARTQSASTGRCSASSRNA
jgi:hypothetical protein